MVTEKRSAQASLGLQNYGCLQPKRKWRRWNCLISRALRQRIVWFWHALLYPLSLSIPVNAVLEEALHVCRSRQHQGHRLDGRGRQPQQARNLNARDVQALGREEREAAQRVSLGLVLVAELC